MAAELLDFAKNQERKLAAKIVESRRRLPPLINDSALFTLASTYGDPRDPYFHAASTRVGAHFTPSAAYASAVLFEEFPQVRESKPEPTLVACGV